MIFNEKYIKVRDTKGFRLLNSEIGNDQMPKMTRKDIKRSFRLLNSEIGNDPNYY